MTQNWRLSRSSSQMSHSSLGTHSRLLHSENRANAKSTAKTKNTSRIPGMVRP